MHLAVLRVLPEVIRESVDAERHADYRKGEGGKGTEGERRDAGRIVAVNQGKRDGSGVDADASSKSVIIYDPATGEKKMVSPTAVDGIESLGRGQDGRAERGGDKRTYAGHHPAKQDWLEGNVANPVGMQIQLGDGRIATIEAMHEDGKSAIATLPDALSSWCRMTCCRESSTTGSMRITKRGEMPRQSNERQSKAPRAHRRQPRKADSIAGGGSLKRRRARVCARRRVDVVVDGRRCTQR